MENFSTRSLSGAEMEARYSSFCNTLYILDTNNNAIMLIFHNQAEVLIRYIRDRHEQHRILRACHSDPTAGHLGFRKTLARIAERFAWKGMVKDCQELVRHC